MTQKIELDRGILERFMSLAEEKQCEIAKNIYPIVQVINIQNIAKSMILKYQLKLENQETVPIYNGDYYDEFDHEENENKKIDYKISSEINAKSLISSSVDRYLLILSDGEFYETRCLLLPNLNYLINSTNLRKGSIIRLDHFELISIPNGGNIIAIDQITVLKNTIKRNAENSLNSNEERKIIINNNLSDTLKTIGIIGLLKPTSNNIQTNNKDEQKNEPDSEFYSLSAINPFKNQYKQQYELIELKLKQILNEEKRKLDENEPNITKEKKENNEIRVKLVDDKKNEAKLRNLSNQKDNLEIIGDDFIAETDDEENKEYDENEKENEGYGEEGDEEICECSNCQDKNTIKLCYRIMDLSEKATIAQIKEKYLSLINSNFKIESEPVSKSISKSNSMVSDETSNNFIQNEESEFNLNKLMNNLSKNIATNSLQISDSDRLEITTKAYNLIMGKKLKIYI